LRKKLSQDLYSANQSSTGCDADDGDVVDGNVVDCDVVDGNVVDCDVVDGDVVDCDAVDCTLL
jgi:hypothetical protein